MSEKIPNGIPSHESGPKAEVIAKYKKFIDRGATDPDALEKFGTEEEIEEAEEAFFAWIERMDEETDPKDPESELRANLEKTMFYVDAGFTDADYLDEVLHDFLISNDWDNAPAIEGNVEREKTRAMLMEAMERIAKMLDQKLDYELLNERHG